MEPGMITSASANGSLAAVGGAVKAFALAHPLTMATMGGAVLGIGTYYALGRLFRKKTVTSAAVPVAA
jgi:hypothetical protein